jgi:hypothetical protein
VGTVVITGVIGGAIGARAAAFRIGDPGAPTRSEVRWIVLMTSVLGAFAGRRAAVNAMEVGPGLDFVPSAPSNR